MQHEDISVEMEEHLSTITYRIVTSNSSTALPAYVTPLNWTRTVVVALSMVPGLPANGFMVFTIVTNRQIRRSLRNVLLLHLACCGLLLSLLVLPFNIASALSQRVAMSSLCKGEGYFTTVVISATLWTITSICVEKYRSIARPLHHRTTVSKWRVTVVFSCVWLSAFFISGLPIYFGRPYAYDSIVAACRVNYHSHDPVGRAISGVLVSATFLAPFIILIICHVRIYLIAKSHRKSISGTLQWLSAHVQAPIIAPNVRRRVSHTPTPMGRKKAIRTTSYIMTAFVLLYLPITSLNLCEIIRQQAQHPVWAILAATAIQVSPAVNASVYGLNNRSLRYAFTEWYRRKLANYAQRLTLPKPKKITLDDFPLKLHYSFRIKKSVVDYPSGYSSPKSPKEREMHIIYETIV